MSKSASLPASPYDPYEGLEQSSNDFAVAPAWKQEVNQRLAAHRTRRGGPQEAADSNAAARPGIANTRAAEAAARVAARYAKAPSYSQLLAGEARAVVRAAGAAAVAARNAQAAAEAVLAGLESAPIASGLWEPAPQHSNYAANRAIEQPAPPANQTAAEAAWAAMPDTPPRWQDEPPVARVAPASPPAHQARWEETVPVSATPVYLPQALAHSRDVWEEMRVYPAPAPGLNHQNASAHSYSHEPDAGELFHHDPLASATVEPVQSIPANLIEFPRELIAARKARPRLVESAYYCLASESPQLSIFEVDPELLQPITISDTPIVSVAPPEWATIELDHPPEPAYIEHPAAPVYTDPVYAVSAFSEPVYASVAYHKADYAEAAYEETLPMAASPARFADADTYYPETYAPQPYHEPYYEQAPGQARPQIAPAEAVQPLDQVQVDPGPANLLVADIGDRVMAATVDGALVTLAFLASAVVVIASTAHPPTGRIAVIASGCGLLLFGLLYEFLFLSFSEEGTPGMRYARIALCTFADDNPTRQQMLIRIPSLLLSALPLGLGLLWAIFDGDHLCWHDRLTKTYQRKY